MTVQPYDRITRLVSGMFVGVMCLVSAASAQEASDAAPAAARAVPDGDTLERIRSALASTPALDLRRDGLRFFAEVVVEPRTFADYLRGSDLRFGVERPEPPGRRDVLGGGTGVDLLQVARSVIGGFRSAARERRQREVNEQIDRELAAIEGE